MGYSAVASADLPLDADLALSFNGFTCTLSGSTTVATTVTLYDDAVATDLSCTVAAGETSCATLQGARVAVAAGSALAIETLNATDNLSGDDVRCNASVSF